MNTSQWNKDLDNATNKAFVKSFQDVYGRLPSLYASQGFDTANLVISALEKADVKNAGAFRDALRAADFESTRGDFSFASNSPCCNIKFNLWSSLFFKMIENKLKNITVWGVGPHAEKNIIPAIKKNKKLNLYGICTRDKKILKNNLM